MRKGAAFRFIPELLGDFEHVMELSGNPKLLYVDSALNTMHAASDVFQTFEEYGNTKRKIETLEAIKKKYKDLEGIRLKNYQDEEIHRLDIAYEKVKNKIQNGQFGDKEVRSFIQSLEKDLKKAVGLFQEIQADPDYPERAQVEEIARKTIRDYQKILRIYIEEEEKNGED